MRGSRVALRRTHGFNRKNAWLTRQAKDPLARAVRENKAALRSRARFKLVEIDNKHKLLRRNCRVADLGAAPGGWAKLCAERVHRGGALRGLVVAIDLLDMDPIAGVDFVQGDFTNPEVQARVAELVRARKSTAHHGKLDVVLSDMAPNTTGDKPTDHARSLDLAHTALDFAESMLRRDGSVLCKFFQGGEMEELVDRAKGAFGLVKVVKPRASRPESVERFLLGLHYRGAGLDEETNQQQR